jgi:hypothetical protein
MRATNGGHTQGAGGGLVARGGTEGAVPCVAIFRLGKQRPVDYGQSGWGMRLIWMKRMMGGGEFMVD